MYKTFFLKSDFLCVRHPGGEAEAHPDDIAELDPQSITTKCLLHQATEATAPPAVQPENNNQTSASPGDGGETTTHKPAIREVPLLLLLSSRCVPLVLSQAGGGVGRLSPRKQARSQGSHDLSVKKAIGWTLNQERMWRMCFSSFFCKYPAALLTETPWKKGSAFNDAALFDSWWTFCFFMCESATTSGGGILRLTRLKWKVFLYERQINVDGFVLY